MDWKLFLTTFSTVFVAELGDKTQFASLLLAAQNKSWISVLLGSILALSLAATIGVCAGHFLGQFVSPKVLKYVSGTLFMAVGLMILIKQ